MQNEHSIILLARDWRQNSLIVQLKIPRIDAVRACAEFARSTEINLIVGLGGGSSMDTAKGCNFLLTNGGKMADYWGVGKANQPMLPLIAIPTTAGTGSECQSFALISDDETHMKMAGYVEIQRLCRKLPFWIQSSPFHNLNA